ncbi:MAG: DUF2652 domain-containing protein [Candidatus Aenigmarchaeota archaeon]|nr:DUF2652 domain-containing protein [Candidatus Aenigmarchaeota archaeon]
MSKVNKGGILLADISGYTRLVTSLSLEHSRSVVNMIFKKMYAATVKDYDVKEIEGDAIFALSVQKDKQKLFNASLKQVEKYADAFYSVRNELTKNPPECKCEFCAHVDKMSIKFIVHYGEYTVDQIGPIKSVVGKDIVLAHRLLKNSVKSKSYILVTEDALKLDKNYQDGLKDAHIENVEYFGDVRVGVKHFEWDEGKKGNVITGEDGKKGFLGVFGKG